MKPILHAVMFTTASITVLLAAHLINLQTQIPSLENELRTANVQLNDITESNVHMEEMNTELETQISVLSGLVEQKKVFLTRTQEYQVLETQISDKIDTQPWRQKVLTIQESFKASATPEEASTQVAVLETTIQDLQNAYTTWEAEQKAAAEAAARSSSTSTRTSGTGSKAGNQDFYGEARSILNQLGGGWVDLRVLNEDCQGVSEYACALPGRIYISPLFSGLSYGRKHWMVAHEYAHMFQFQNWGTIYDSQKFYDLYGGDIELLANCMVRFRGWDYGYGHSCSPQQIQESGGIWGGVF